MFRQISYLEPELRAFTSQEKLTFLRKFIYRVSQKNCSTFDKILKNNDTLNGALVKSPLS